MKYRNQIYFVLGTVILGALGSGLWEYAFKGVFNYTTNWILNVATFGLDSIKDSMYLSIARGFRESSSLVASTFIIFLLFYIYLIFGISLFLQGDKAYIFSFFLNRGTPENYDTRLVSAEQKPKMYRALNVKIFKVLGLVAIFLSLTFLMMIVRASYVNKATSHYMQMLRISAPYITIQREQEIQSKFSLIKNDRDYIAVLGHLNKIADEQGLEPPVFNVW